MKPETEVKQEAAPEQPEAKEQDQDEGCQCEDCSHKYRRVA